MKMKFFYVLGFAGLLCACNNSSVPAANSAAPANTTQDAALAASSSSAGGSDITVTLTGGANAGTYTAHSKESTCSVGIAGEHAFGNQYSVEGKSNKEMSSVQVVADNYDEAKKGTDDFSATISFGKLLEGASYDLHPKNGVGTGTLTVTESGSGRTVTIEGKTKDGVGVKATITCKTAMVMVNGEMKEQ